MPDPIPTPKDELPITDWLSVRRCKPGNLDVQILTAAIRADGFVVLDGRREDIARAYLALCSAARACGQALARIEMAAAFDAVIVASDPVVRRIDEIQQAAGDTLAPETVTLMELAKEAQATGQMPDLSRLNDHEPKCCQ